ncbi:hypothetical protein E2C01_097925 [Portunus trituberculatus]|uniref:Uncharacterized protein n=1 Tax=Portunus trituberculatus TaxID=210409 RepID=A0A5B7K714_PORTR|nr:hypothetical protein [Portunus trituberculatus]
MLQTLATDHRQPQFSFHWAVFVVGPYECILAMVYKPSVVQVCSVNVRCSQRDKSFPAPTRPVHYSRMAFKGRLLYRSLCMIAGASSTSI